MCRCCFTETFLSRRGLSTNVTQSIALLLKVIMFLLYNHVSNSDIRRYLEIYRKYCDY